MCVIIFKFNYQLNQFMVLSSYFIKSKEKNQLYFKNSNCDKLHVIRMLHNALYQLL